MVRIEFDDLSRPQALALLEEHLRNIELSPSRHPAYVAAQTLYASAGFERCAPFGPYRENGNSVFMSLVI
jgi:hypothetical protein